MDIKNYRHKRHPGAAIIRAVQVTADNAETVSVWCRGVFVVEHNALNHEETFGAVNVPTWLGNKRAQEGDFVIQDAAMEFHVRHGAEFLEQFEVVEDSKL